MSALFEPITIHGLEIRNRIWLSPMCMYSVPEQDGVPNEWHLVHYGSLAQGGFGLLMAEATGVSPEGRITPYDLGLWSNAHIDYWADIVDFVHTQGAAMGVQLGHAGRKASRNRPFPGEPQIAVEELDGGWQPIGPSPIAHEDFRIPQEMTVEDISRIVDCFKKSARRARKAGFDVVEIHGAHGYLISSFLSPLSNHRTDEYGGSFENRIRLLLQIVDTVREVWDGPLFVRISATEWVPGGWTPEESVKLADVLKSHYVDLIDVSTGGNVAADIPLAPSYQVRFADQIKREANIATSAVGLITDPKQAEDIVASGKADAVMLGRVALREPFWPLRAAFELDVRRSETPYQPELHRGVWPGHKK